MTVALKRVMKLEPVLALLCGTGVLFLFFFNIAQYSLTTKLVTLFIVLLNLQTTLTSHNHFYQQPRGVEEVHRVSAINLCRVLPPCAKGILYVGAGLPS